MRNFKELKVWQKAHQFVLDVYRSTSDFPPAERFGLTSQLRRAAISIPGNIAEGCGRRTDRDLARFLDNAGGSGCECEYYLLLGHELRYLRTDNFRRLDDEVNEVKRMLNAFTRAIRTSGG